MLSSSQYPKTLDSILVATSGLSMSASWHLSSAGVFLAFFGRKITVMNLQVMTTPTPSQNQMHLRHWKGRSRRQWGILTSSSVAWYHHCLKVLCTYLCSVSVECVASLEGESLTKSSVYSVDACIDGSFQGRARRQLRWPSLRGDLFHFHGVYLLRRRLLRRLSYSLRFCLRFVAWQEVPYFRLLWRNLSQNSSPCSFLVLLHAPSGWLSMLEAPRQVSLPWTYSKWLLAFTFRPWEPWREW